MNSEQGKSHRKKTERYSSMSVPNNPFQDCRPEILYEVNSHGFAPLKPNSITPIDFEANHTS